MNQTSPIFIVGLPRSGSTLLSRILNESPDILCVNDLYYLQTVRSIGAEDGPLSSETAERLVDSLLEVLATRSERNSRFIGQFRLSQDQLRQIRDSVLSTHRSDPLDWAGLMDMTLSLAAACIGKTVWADKTPQNFLHLDLLREAFPKAGIIFLLRDPRTTLASLKHASGPGHDKRRFHPLPYSLYWRAAARTCLEQVRRTSRTRLLRYEDILQNADEVRKDLSDFLDTDIPPLDLGGFGNNSSFDARRRKTLLPTETWLCQRICRQEMEALGYPAETVIPQFGDWPELFSRTLGFSVFQARRLATSADGRKRILALASKIAPSRNPGREQAAP